MNHETKHFRRMFKIGEIKFNKRRTNSALRMEGVQPPPLKLLTKDHKDVRPDGTRPSRPLCLSKVSPNGGLSEIISKMANAITDSHDLKFECQSKN